ncbi:hypothetical protein [Desulfitobacterium sp.]|uniref:hypothetical protein n=1 Tax=Desulfitobacterium sp. TaxID=49981 RepID=UPI002C316E34|nr:hypothetical protein [Desulfitobacterium sp.]HVJ47711.1 hypothetical protein [Desulfitobacterium sp.]
MNCCDNEDKSENNSQQEKKHKGHMPHMLMMILCCGAPLLILLFLPVISTNVSPNVRNLLITIVPFICPIMMVFMMPMMMKGNKDKQAEHNPRELKESENVTEK